MPLDANAALTLALQYSSGTSEDQAQIVANADDIINAAERATADHDWHAALALATTIMIDSAALLWCPHSAQGVRLGYIGIAAARALADDTALAALLHNTAVALWAQGELAEALQRLKASLAIKERLGDKIGIASTLQALGSMAEDSGEGAEARQWYTACLTTQQHIGDVTGIVHTLSKLGRIARNAGDPAQARRCIRSGSNAQGAIGRRARNGVLFISDGRTRPGTRRSN